METTTKSSLSLNLRILIGIASLPSLILAAMLVMTIYYGDYKNISAFELVYSCVGFFGLYIALSGKKPF
jgi:hypothetical protein